MAVVGALVFHKHSFFKGSKYLLPGKILSSKSESFGGKILITKDDPPPQPIGYWLVKNGNDSIFGIKIA